MILRFAARYVRAFLGRPVVLALGAFLLFAIPAVAVSDNGSGPDLPGTGLTEPEAGADKYGSSHGLVVNGGSITTPPAQR